MNMPLTGTTIGTGGIVAGGTSDMPFVEYDFGGSPNESQNPQPQEPVGGLDRLLSFIGMSNIADALSTEELSVIATQCKLGYDIDKETRKKWDEDYSAAIDLAKMTWTRKDTPFPNASNVKHPMIAQAAIQFNSRAMPNIIPESGNIVKCRVIGKDNAGNKSAKAERVSRHMSYQLGEQMDDWESDMDKTLITLPIVGTAFKKTYHDPDRGRHVSELVYAQNLIVNNDAPSLSRAPRASERVFLYPNEVRERIMAGVWRDIDTSPENVGKEENARRETPNEQDEDAQQMFIEQHCWFDLDKDGYKEPYIVTFHYDTQQVVRIVARYDFDDVKVKNGTLIRIEPIEYYTMYTFIPDPDGKLFGMGFGMLFKSTAETINTAINQLLDAGHDQNAGGGIIDDKLRRGTGGGNKNYMEFERGKYYWLKVSSGQNIKDSIFQRPTSEPSKTLFDLMKYLTEHSERAMSSTDVLSGQQTLANVPATTTMALIEQGLKVFGAVYKRIHKSLAEELRKIKRLNQMYLDEEEYIRILDDETATLDDYNDTDLDVVPVSDPNNINDAQVLLKAEAMLGMLGQGYNDDAIRRRYLEALKIPNYEELLEGGQPQVDPKIEIEKAKLEVETRRLDIEERQFQLEVMQAEVEARKTLAQAEQATAMALKAIADAEAAEEGRQIEQYQTDLESSTKTIERMKTIIEKQMGLLDKTTPQQTQQRQPTPQENIT